MLGSSFESVRSALRDDTNGISSSSATDIQTHEYILDANNHTFLWRPFGKDCVDISPCRAAPCSLTNDRHSRKLSKVSSLNQSFCTFSDRLDHAVTDKAFVNSLVC